MVGCLAEECNYGFGSRTASQVYSEAKELMRLLGYREEQLGLLRIANNFGKEFSDFSRGFYYELCESLR
jgi:coenzyme F420-reducing hydrogenase delta subunit